MTPRLLLDTHIAIRYLVEPVRLSREQRRAIEATRRRCEPLALSAVTLIEVALLSDARRLTVPLDDILDALQTPVFDILPITGDIAREMTYFAPLRDPFDRIIVATARIHKLRLVTADERIIESKTVAVLE